MSDGANRRSLAGTSRRYLITASWMMFDKDMSTIFAGSKPTIVDKDKSTIFMGVLWRYLTEYVVDVQRSKSTIVDGRRSAISDGSSRRYLIRASR